LANGAPRGVIFVWVNKREWCHPGPIVNMAVRNAHSFALAGAQTHLCLGAGSPSDTAGDLSEFYDVAPTETLQIHRISRTTALSLGRHTSSGPIFRAAVRLVAGLLRSNPEQKIVIISREGSFLPHLWWLRRRFGPRIQTLYEAHDLYADLSWRRNENQKIKTQDLRQKWLELFFLPTLQGLICITEAQRQLYQRLFPRVPSLAVPLGTNPPQTDLTTESRRKLRRAVYVGRLSRGKGLDLLLRAAPRLREKQIRLAFWGGNAEQMSSLLARAAALGLRGWVEGASTRSPRDLQSALAGQATVGLVPLADNFYNRFLTCPVKALDYLSQGLPVVASDLESTREVLGADGAGSFFPSSNDTALAESIIDLVDQPDRYARAVCAAARRGEELSWRHRAEKIISWCEQLN
jgi:glycosyltransferase involved in cell wall biosynthesis